MNCPRDYQPHPKAIDYLISIKLNSKVYFVENGLIFPLYAQHGDAIIKTLMENHIEIGDRNVMTAKDV